MHALSSCANDGGLPCSSLPSAVTLQRSLANAGKLAGEMGNAWRKGNARVALGEAGAGNATTHGLPAGTAGSEQAPSGEKKRRCVAQGRLFVDGFG